MPAFLVFGIGLSAAQTPYIDQKDLSITADTPPVHDATVGTLAGSAGTEGGAATYNIPIVVPPGRAGMQPSLALSYNSRGGDGVMGMGWSISGLSSIHRCPQTLEQDGQALGVAYAATDRLCLDGQRLVLASGTYGAAGATYKTEIDSYARITQVGGNLISTAACFRVEQKDGRILHYGAVTTGTPTATACAASSANARVQPTGAAATLSWLVEKIEDRPGNNQLYSYSNFGNGEVLPNVISYTGYGATAGDRSVTFAYQARSAAASGLTDVASSSYLAGGLTMQTKALLSVTTRVGTSVVRVVTPSYAASAYSGRLLVDSMQECAYSGATQACHPATQFESTSDGSSPAPQNFHLSPLALGVPGPQGLPPIDMTQSEATAERSALMRTMAPTTTDPDDGVTQLAQIAGDFDGDGTRETAMAVSRTDGQHDYVVQMTQDRQLHNAVEVTGILCYYWECYADFAGDGRSEAIVVPHSASDPAFIRLAAWTLPRGAVAQPGTNPFHLITTTIPSPIFPASNQPVGNVPRALDLNGDGRLDLVVQRTDAACGSDALGLKSGIYGYFNTVKINPTTHQIDESQPLFDSGRRLFCLNRTFTGNALTYNENIDHVGDFDGNGEPDFFVVDTRAFQSPSLVKVIGLQRSGSDVVALAAKSCTDIGLVSSGTALTDECQWSNGYAIRWMDVNGDGLDDFVIARPNGAGDRWLCG